MKKEFSKFQVATIKRVAQSVYPLVRVKTRLQKEIEEREKELASIQIQIDAFQGPIKEMTGGYSSEDLVVREVVDTGKKDKQGNPVKTTTYKLKYPETVIPVTEAIAAAVDAVVAPGSDFDIDKSVQTIIDNADEMPPVEVPAEEPENSMWNDLSI